MSEVAVRETARERANREHPYETPQVLAVPVIDANPAYRDWVLASTRDDDRHAETDPSE